jgi:hypothetical protein
MMQEIQTTRILRDKNSLFVRHLECLRLIDDGPIITFKEAQINVFRENCQCAIASWSWKPSIDDNEVARGGICLIEEDFFNIRRSEVRYSIWKRAAAYMRHTGVDYLWIDAECITQEDCEEKEKAMREMDLLYRYGSHPFGLLTRSVETETELHLLAQILQGELACQSGSRREFPLKKGLAIASAREAIWLLNEITSDIWWTRAWIYQENYHGGKLMRLLMPHNIALESSKAEYGDLFGDLKGELVILSFQFSEALTEICSAFIAWSAEDDPQQEVAHRILSRAGRYAKFLEERHSMSPRVIADVVSREVTKYPDRLPIIANCCSYSTRLDNNMLARKGCSTSLAILVSFLLNGEIFYFEPDGRPGDISVPASDLTVVEFIQRYAFDRFSPPFPGHELSFNKSCRFSTVNLEGGGVHTSGHLWKLRRPPITIPWDQPEDQDPAKTLWRLHEYIQGDSGGENPLSRQLKKFLGKTRGAKWPESPSDEYRCTMALKLADALHEGAKLRLGYACGSLMNHGWSDPMAIFICPDEIMRESHGSVFVFTSYADMTMAEGTAYTSGVRKHVSLQVDVQQNGYLPPKLFARAWMHGLDLPQVATTSVVFPLPRILGEL